MEKAEIEKCAYCGKPGKESSARMNVNVAMKKNFRKTREISDIFF